MSLDSYDTGGFYDELFDSEGKPRPVGELVIEKIKSLKEEDLKRRQSAAELALLNLGITFGVYGSKKAQEKIFPFDIVPRIIADSDWQKVQRGVTQRTKALNLFIADIYSDQKILKDKVVPSDLILGSVNYRKECIGFRPPKDVWIHITGTDLVRDLNGDFLVLEDNLRCPSGVSYVLENRSTMKKIFPGLFKAHQVRTISDYCDRLYDTLKAVAPSGVANPNVALLTPGSYNSAYFEHAYLAQQMGIPLVQGQDLVVIDGELKVRTTGGFQRIDVLYRRIDDDFLDPKVFRKDSMLGVPGLMDCYMKGKVTLANAPGTGFADDKAVYSYVPEIIKYYLGEEAILKNVQTYLCRKEDDKRYVIENLDKLVVKEVGLSGGYGMLIGPHSKPEEREEFKKRIEANPANYIAQPTISLSRTPTLIGKKIQGRHVDLRPFVLYGDDIFVLPGGLTRVALVEGSLVVNSSQGGGSKDTWVVRRE